MITDRPAVALAAIGAVGRALAEGVPGCLGIHVETPFIAPARKGAHDPALIRRRGREDLHRLCETKVRPLLLTLAPERVGNAQIAALDAAGIHVSIGHSDGRAQICFAMSTSLIKPILTGMNHQTELNVIDAPNAEDARSKFGSWAKEKHLEHELTDIMAIKVQNGG